MYFAVEYLSFFVITIDGDSKHYRHFQTLSHDEYQDSQLKEFLDGEYGKIVKRKVEKHPMSEQVPTKIGRFLVEPGYDVDSNPNYNLFTRLRAAEQKQEFLNNCDEMVNMYMQTTAVRGGAFIVVRAKWTKYFDEPFIFVLKCDFEPKIARITDEKSLINHVEMAISAKNMKSIQYPFMPEDGILELWEVKIHQASHARYFEDFLKFVSYEKSIPEIVNTQVMEMVQQYVEEKWPQTHPEREQEERALELWAASEKREMQERWNHDQVVEAATQLVEQKPELEMKLKLDHILIKALLSDYGTSVHIAKSGGRYVLLIEGDSFTFEKGFSPIELLQPEDLLTVTQKIQQKSAQIPPPF